MKGGDDDDIYDVDDDVDDNDNDDDDDVMSYVLFERCTLAVTVASCTFPSAECRISQH